VVELCSVDYKIVDSWPNVRLAELHAHASKRLFFFASATMSIKIIELSSATNILVLLRFDVTYGSQCAYQIRGVRQSLDTVNEVAGETSRDIRLAKVFHDRVAASMTPTHLAWSAAALYATALLKSKKSIYISVNATPLYFLKPVSSQ